MRSCHHEPLSWQGVPRFQRGAHSPTGSRHVVLRANFDRKCYPQKIKGQDRNFALLHLACRQV